MKWPGGKALSRLTLVVTLFAVSEMSAQTNDAPPRLAIISEATTTGALADLLAVELSRQPELRLLERAQIEKVYREQALAGGNRDYLKLGQLLGADGLLLLETGREATNEWLRIQLVAVKPGVLLSSERYPWPIPNLAPWAGGVSTHLNPLLPKLGVLAKDAVPISVVNLRSAIQSSESRETERQLTLLAIERLSRERRLFVLERRRMQLLTGEKDLNGLDDTAFWDGSYLLDGGVDRNGFAPDTITISARLVPPGGAAPLPIEAAGNRTNLAEVINHLADGILKALTINRDPAPWEPADEANQFYAEAQWAFRWKLYPQAQAASESAWALGRRTPESAQLLVRSYVESMPDSSVNGDDGMHVLQIPDASAFPKLDRGLEFVLQNAPVFFGSTNSLDSFTLGMRLLRQAFNQLEGYYYARRNAVRTRGRPARAAVQRPPHVEEGLEVQAATITNEVKWNDPRLTFAALRWREGGVAFERPEDALGFYRDLLSAGAKPAGLPRIIGWTWPDRQRTPAVMRQLVDDARTSTNPAVRLEGLLLALLLAPDDEQGSLRRAEEELVSALWEDRALLFRDAEQATLVERTRVALTKKTGDDDMYKAFAHEPFAGFKHRLRMAFLADPANTNVAVMEQFFPNTSVKMETPEQARELLPLMEGWCQNQVQSNRFTYKLTSLRQSAGATRENPASAPALAAAAVVEARFIPWKTAPGGDDSYRTPQFNGMMYRHGRLWVRVRYLDPQSGGFGIGGTDPTSYLAADPQRGVTTEIPFPKKQGYPGRLFEVSENALFVEAGGRLWQYVFQTRNWKEISVPMEGASSLVWLGGRLFVGRGDGLLAVNLESGNVQVLVSSRRTPPANEIDPLWSADTQIFALADGRLGALAHDDFLLFDSTGGQWSIRPLPLKGTNGFFNLTADYFSTAGAQRLLTGPYARRYLVGFWNDGPAESLLMEETGIRAPPSRAEKLLPPLRWDWPKNYPMEHSQIVVEGKTLWALAPRRLGMMMGNPEPVKFSDARDATLFCFGPEAREPLSVAVRFPTNALPRLPIMNGQPTGILEPFNFDFMSIFQRLDRHVGNMAFWLRVPGGLVFGGPKYCGHWFIADAAMEREFAAQRERRRLKTTPPTSPATTPQTP
ncbi:MAG: CsgG/HfaB family protein [Verrucomicrobiota bacterium]